MDLRQATTDDIPGIRRVARESLMASYDFLDESVIEEAVEQWYDEGTFGESIEGEYDVILVATVDGEVAGYSESAILGEHDTTGEIQWLHVAPEYRGQGLASELYDRTVEVIRQGGVERIRGLVLVGHEEGARFYEDRGLDRVGERTVEVGNEKHRELIYETDDHHATAESAAVERRETDGQTVYVFREEGYRGSTGRFHPAYSDPDQESLYGWFCANCGTFDNAVGSMGQIECNECGNLRKPTRWDAAYL